MNWYRSGDGGAVCYPCAMERQRQGEVLARNHGTEPRRCVDCGFAVTYVAPQ